jgi:hypothetical protein
VEQEWLFLGRLAETNGQIIEIANRQRRGDDDVFSCRVRGVPGLVRAADRITQIDDHAVSIYLRPLFPELPLELQLGRPVFHPNVHPDNGFVCLWNRPSSAETVIEAFQQLWRVLLWERWNDRMPHVMQPDALDWVRASPSEPLPLQGPPLLVPADVQASRTERVRPAHYNRTRLEPAG